MSAVKQSVERLQAVEKTLNSIIVGHEEMTKAILVGLVAGEHVALIGAPGTAKSFTVHSLAKLLSAKFYRYLLTRFTDYSEVFGPVDIKQLADGQYVRRWSGIVSADIVFLDEIFKANSAILNSLLSLLQERVVYDPMTGTPQPVGAWSVIGASNETPADEELQALYDRFSVRVFVDYLNDDVALLRAIEARWLQPQNHVEVQPLASMEDVKAVHQYALQLLVANIKQLNAPLYKVYHANVTPMIKSMRAKGVLVSDRTAVEKLPKLFAAYLALYGVTVDNVFNAPLELARWLARDRSQLADIQETIDDALGEVAELARKLEEAKTKLKVGEFKSAVDALDDILTYDVSRLADKPWLRPRAEAIVALARTYKRKVEEQLKLLQQLAEEVEGA